jgi:hypothetical protein
MTRAFYLDGMHCVLHEADGPVSVLLCPPLAWDEIASARPRYALAERLAAAGRPTLRFDLPGTGDSAGSWEDPELVRAWIGGVGAAACFLAATGSRVVAVGIGGAGLLVLAALADGAPIDDAVLWGTPATGKAAVRELRAFARLEAAAIVDAGAPPGPAPPEGMLAPGGLPLAPRTLAALSELDAAGAAPERALLLGRDGIAPDAALVEALAARGSAVETADGAGYGALTDLPATARLADASVAVVERWLAAAPPAAGRRPDAPVVADALDLGAVLERPFAAAGAAGVLAEPTGPRRGLTAVLLNAGAIRRVGPSRFWVDLARRWAAEGVPTLRLDLEGIGDAAGPVDRYGVDADFYTDGFVAQVRRALDELGEGPFLVGGLCSGAWWAFRAAVDDERIASALMVNSRVLVWDDALGARRDASAVRRRLFEPATWRRVLRGELAVRPLRILRGLVARAPAAAPDEGAAALRRLAARGTRVELVFCAGEPLREELRALEPFPPNVELQELPGRDHLFRPLWMHEHLLDAADRALGRALGSSRAPTDRATVPAPVGDGDRQHDA